MRRIMIVLVAFALLSEGSMAMAQMQTPGTAQPGQQPMMGQGMMGMACPTMGAMMSTADPKTRARMLKLHGDMMKAMGEVMVKHGQAMEQEK